MSEERYLKLLVRPNVEPSEEVAEYLQRLAKANGFHMLSPLMNLIGVPLNDVVVRGHEKLREVIAGKAPCNSLKIPRNSKKGISPHVDLSGVFATARVCCSCLKESDLLQSNWSEPLSISCSKHNEVLLDQCPRCSRILLRRGSHYQCICGQEFKAVTASPSPPWLTRFYELFAPWRIHQPLEAERSLILRAEIYTARLVNKLLSSLAADSRSNFRLQAWIKASAHESLGVLCRPDFALGPAIVNMNKELYRGWRSRVATLCEPAPAAFQLVEATRRQSRKDNLKAVFAHQRIMRAQADSPPNIARALNVSRRTAYKLIRSSRWQSELRLSVNALERDSLLSCVTKWIGNTYSVDDVRTLTGFSGTWLTAFCNKYRTECLNSKAYSTWRFPKKLVDSFIQGIEHCLCSGEHHFDAKDGFISLRELSNKGNILPLLIFHRVAQGALPMAREKAALTSPVRLLECIVPAHAIEQLVQPSWRNRHWRTLIRYPEARPCPS